MNDLRAPTVATIVIAAIPIRREQFSSEYQLYMRLDTLMKAGLKAHNVIRHSSTDLVLSYRPEYVGGNNK